MCSPPSSSDLFVSRVSKSWPHSIGLVVYNDESGDGSDWNIGFANEHDKKYWLTTVLAQLTRYENGTEQGDLQTNGVPKRVGFIRPAYRDKKKAAPAAGSAAAKTETGGGEGEGGEEGDGDEDGDEGGKEDGDKQDTKAKKRQGAKGPARIKVCEIMACEIMAMLDRAFTPAIITPHPHPPTHTHTPLRV
jgi:hypothetical protein